MGHPREVSRSRVEILAGLVCQTRVDFGRIAVIVVGLSAAPACALDRLDHEGRCPTKELPVAFEGEDLELLRGYTRIGGDVRVPGGVRDLSALRCLETVDGTLSIAADRLRDLDGLENLRNVGGLGLSEMPVLEDVSALSGLREIRGDLSFNNVGLRTIEAPLDLERLDGGVSALFLPELERWEAPIGPTKLDGLVIFGVAADARITAFAEVETITADVTIGAQGMSDLLPGGHVYLHALTSASGVALQAVVPEVVASLRSLHTVQSLGLLNVPELRSLEGLESLQVVTSLGLSKLPALENLDGLSGVRQMPTITRPDFEGTTLPTIGIGDCPALVDISGLSGIQSDHLWQLTLSGVPKLERLDMPPALRAIGALHLEATGLTDLGGLAAITTLDLLWADPVTGENIAGGRFAVRLENNPALMSIDALDPTRGGSVTSVGSFGEIIAHDNPRLPTCAVERLAESLAALGATEGYSDISGNDDTASCR